MISRIRGELLRKEGDVVEVMTPGGVGYELTITAATWGDLPEVGGQVDLRTLQIVREDSISLYGFATDLERTVFGRLLSASGVGPRTALSTLSTLGSAGVVSAVRERDAKTLTSIPGIGKKSAERLIVELSGRFDDLDVLPEQSGATANLHVAVEALVALGYSRDTSSRAVQLAVEDSPDLQGPALIRAALASVKA